jgi:hypothetical protein
MTIRHDKGEAGTPGGSNSKSAEQLSHCASLPPTNLRGSWCEIEVRMEIGAAHLLMTCRHIRTHPAAISSQPNLTICFPLKKDGPGRCSMIWRLVQTRSLWSLTVAASCVRWWNAVRQVHSDDTFHHWGYLGNLKRTKNCRLVSMIIS